MSFTRILSFSRSPMRIPSRRAVWLAVAGLLVFLATGAPASATNLLYVSLYYDTRIVSYDVAAGDGAAIAASRRRFRPLAGWPRIPVSPWRADASRPASGLTANGTATWTFCSCLQGYRFARA